jgi:hypothetical protein
MALVDSAQPTKLSMEMNANPAWISKSLRMEHANIAQNQQFSIMVLVRLAKRASFTKMANVKNFVKTRNSMTLIRKLVSKLNAHGQLFCWMVNAYNAHQTKFGKMENVHSVQMMKLLRKLLRKLKVYLLHITSAEDARMKITNTSKTEHAQSAKLQELCKTVNAKIAHSALHTKVIDVIHAWLQTTLLMEYALPVVKELSFWMESARPAHSDNTSSMDNAENANLLLFLTIKLDSALLAQQTP